MYFGGSTELPKGTYLSTAGLDREYECDGPLIVVGRELLDDAGLEPNCELDTAVLGVGRCGRSDGGSLEIGVAGKPADCDPL